MAEYLGYQGRPKPVDWLGIAKGAITEFDAIEADRQKQRDALEKSADDLVTASKEYKPGQSGSFNELILNGADRVRSTTLDLKKQLMNGQITPTEYKARVGRMSEDWKYLGDFAKSYNDIVAKQIEYLNDPKASKLGEYFLDKQSKLADVANKQLVVDPQTNGVVMTDPDTGMVVDFKTMLIPENQTPEKVDVISDVENFTKGLGATSQFVKGYWTTSPALKAEYQKAKANFTKSMVQNPRSAASILADYVGGYDFYETDSQKKAIEAAGGKAIQLVMGPNGIVTPKLTSAQQDEARAVLDRLVDSRIDVEKDKPEPLSTSKSSKGEGSEGAPGSTIVDYANYAVQDPVFGNAILKDRPMPAAAGQFIESIELGPDGLYRFKTYGYSTPTEKEKAKGVKPKRLGGQFTRAVNPTQAISLVRNILATTTSEDKNEPWSLGIPVSEYDAVNVRRTRPSAAAGTTQKKKLPGT